MATDALTPNLPNPQRYAYRRTLGEGGFGTVHLVYDIRRECEVALKVAKRGWVKDEERSLRLLHHPGIPHVYEIGTYDDLGTRVPYFAMEYVSGVSLAQLLGDLPDQQPRLDPTRVRRFLLELLDILEHMHGRGLVHRDLKPQNIQIEHAGEAAERVRVVDFGLARMVAGGEALGNGAEGATPGFGGTPGYWAPEQQREGGRIDGRTDIYLLGQVVYEMWTGHIKRTQDELVPPGAPAWLAETLKATLVDERDRRPTAAQLRDKLLETKRISWDAPYRGLLEYAQEHSAIFFGRESETEEALEQLDASGIRVVVGASGSGKSSWIRAGLLHELEQRRAAAGRQLVKIVLTPTERPFELLREAFRDAARGTTTIVPNWGATVDEAFDRAYELRGTSRRDGAQDSTLKDLLKRLTQGAQPASSAVLVVDQLEELTTLCPDADERAAVLDMLVGAVSSDGDWRVLLGVRVDFLGTLHSHAGFKDLLDENQSSIAAMAGDALARVVVGPFAGRRELVEDGFVGQILEDMNNEPGGLPLLSHVLHAVWETSSEPRGMTLDGYTKQGGLSGALNQHADETLARLPMEDQGLFDRVYLELAQPREQKGEEAALADGAWTRRRKTLQQSVEALGQDAQAIRRITDPFVKARLLTFEDEQQTLSVSHERLLTAWKYGEGLLQKHQDALRLRRDVEIASKEWETSGQRDGLWNSSPLKLERAEELLRDRLLTLDPLGKRFLAESRAALERARRWKRGGVVVLGLLLVSLAYYAWLLDATNGRLSTQTQLAEQATKEAREAAVALEEANGSLSIESERAKAEAARAEAASKEAQAAAHAERQRADEVLRLSATTEVERLVARADQLWPPCPAHIPAMEVWIKEMTEHVGQLNAHRSQLASIRERAIQPTAEELEAELRRNVLYPELVALDGLQRSVLQRLAGLRGGPPPELPELTDEQRAMGPRDLDELAWSLVDPSRESYGQEALGLALALYALDQAIGNDEEADIVDIRRTEARAWFELGQIERAIDAEWKAIRLGNFGRWDWSRPTLGLGPSEALRGAAEEYARRLNTLLPQIVERAEAIPRLVRADRTWQYPRRRGWRKGRVVGRESKGACRATGTTW
jgi:serine/threonine protein kinase